MNSYQHQRFIFAIGVLSLLAFIAGLYMLVTGQVATSDWVSFGVMYLVACLGVSTGYHRLLGHRAFVPTRFLWYMFALFGTIAGQGPAIIWVAHHRRHHRFSDHAGDPHSPYNLDDPVAPLTFKGFWHAYMGWLFDQKLTSDPILYCPDLTRDRGMRFLSNHFVSIVIGGVLLGGVIGWAVGGTVTSFLTGMLWGGLIRIFVGNSATYCVNSVGHTFGRRRFLTPEESVNVWWLAIPSFGEGWHNNHHALPRSYTHGMAWYEVDLSSIVIRFLEALGLVRDVVRFDAATRARIAARMAERPGGRAGKATPQAPMASLKPAMAAEGIDPTADIDPAAVE
jgi:stearoyl-CoA desaturase (Delta-9 desaturase)